MPKTIWKKSLIVNDEQKLAVPKGAVFLPSVQRQGGDICVWFICDPAAPLEDRIILMAMTGHDAELESTDVFLGTVLIHSGQIVLHVFARKPF